MNQRGIFISFEGVDGCGKSTQIKELRRRLVSVKEKILLTREPGGTVLGEDIRRILQPSVDSRAISDRSELLLFTASRAQLVTEVLEPALADGKIVIADRFLDSTTIYQGVARGLDRKVVEQINGFSVGTCLPDVTFLIDVDLRTAKERMGTRSATEPLDRLDKLPDSFYQDVRKGYLELAEAAPERFVVVDGKLKLTEISDLIWNTLNKRFDGILS